MNNLELKEIFILLGIGETIVEKLKDEEGYHFCKYALKLCWEWIEKEQDVFDEMYICLDSDEKDFTYYEEMAQDKEGEKIYRNMFHILAYITKRASIINRIERPQYLDYITEEFYEEFIKDIKNTYDNINNIIDKIDVLFDDKIERSEGYITQKEIETLINGSSAN